jgi:hypothetical protein
MWGEVTPAERLRSVTRRLASDDALAAEAADALAGFAAEPASLVVACRRVLAHHPAHGALWWACARILAAPDATLAAREVVDLLARDRTGNRLAAGLPLLDENQFVASIGWPRAVDEAMAERQDLPALAVRVDGADPIAALQRRETERSIRVVEQWDAVLDEVAYLLVSAAAIGPTTALVPAGVGGLLTDFGSSRCEVWLVGGVGRVLPSRLFDAAVAASEQSHERHDFDDAVPETCSLERFDRLAGPRGVESPVDGAARFDCPVVPELLRPLS